MSERQEDFPVASLRHMESKIIKLRSLIMRVASDIAKAESNPEAPSFTVTKAHIDRAFVSFFREIAGNPTGVAEDF